MKINKIVYEGETLIDLTSDTVTPEMLLTGVTAHDRSGEIITGTCDFDVNSRNATVLESDVLNGKICFANGEKIIGTMANNQAITKIINSLSDDYIIPVGYHDGLGVVKIDDNEKAKIVASNIKSGISILGVVGTYSGESANVQSKTVTPSSSSQIISPDSGYDYLSQVTVNAIPYSEESNTAGGTTVNIG